MATTSDNTPTNFNGGKLYHVHKTVPGDRPGSLVYTNEFTDDKAAETLRVGRKELKCDGECAALHRADGQWVFCRRQDNYKGTEPTVPLPPGRQSAHYNQGGKEHNYCWLPVNPSWTTGKGKKRSAPGPDTYAAIATAVKRGLLPDPTDPNAPELITCEWVGTKHQSNMDGVPVEHALVPHMPPFVPELEFTSLDEFKALAAAGCFEGVVVIHPDGTRYKMRCDILGFPTAWTQQCKTKKGHEPGVTSIRPRALTAEGPMYWNGKEWVLE